MLCTTALLLALAAPAAADLNKVLVIGTDGTRWDLVQKEIKAGKAPSLKGIASRGFGRPSLLRYGANTLTLSEVGWSTIASGVWEDKHGVDGHLLNMDPGQATKNGYLDFLTRVERSRPSLSTFLASDWDNIGLPLNGGPIFGSAMDVKFTPRVPSETIDNWNRGDAAVTTAAERYLRHGDPDAGFVYLGPGRRDRPPGRLGHADLRGGDQHHRQAHRPAAQRGPLACRPTRSRAGRSW